MARATRDVFGVAQTSANLLPLASLSPDIVEAILARRKPAHLTVEHLQRLSDLPLEWSKQLQLLGCALNVSGT